MGAGDRGIARRVQPAAGDLATSCGVDGALEYVLPIVGLRVDCIILAEDLIYT